MLADTIRPFSEASNLPGQVHCDPDIFSREAEKIFDNITLGLWAGRTVAGRAAFWSILSAAILGVLSQTLWYREIEGWLGAVHPLFLGPALGLLIMVTANFLWPAIETPAQRGDPA